MCEQFGAFCLLCKRGVSLKDHPARTKKSRNEEYWSNYHSPELEVGARQVEQMERHYAGKGVHIRHKKGKYGGFVPDLRSQADYRACMTARGLHDGSKN
jgi:hypothetical protein